MVIVIVIRLVSMTMMSSLRAYRIGGERLRDMAGK